MELQASLDFFKVFRRESVNQKNDKYLEKFIRLLNELSTRDLDLDQKSKLNLELGLIIENFRLQKDTINVKRELTSFKKFLKSEFSMTSRYYYTELGIAYGIVIGTLLSYVFGSPLFVPLFVLGPFFGLLYGYDKDLKEKKAGKKLAYGLSS